MRGRGEGGEILLWMIKEGFTKKMIFGKRPEGIGGTNPVKIWGRNHLALRAKV